MLDWLFGNKNQNKVNDDEDEERRRSIHNKINLLREEYDAIPGNTYIVEQRMRCFELMKQIVEFADQIYERGGSSYGEMPCEYEVAIHRIIVRLREVLVLKKTNYPNEHKELLDNAHYLLNWRQSNYKRWWHDEKEPFKHDLDREEVHKLFSQIEKISAL